ncbi:hypothetical protein [Undibacterium sp. Ji22W]|uniref:hypothetical protein n=1 Tax=Undibacterium sp. Ji22W TaxID=3413038 RepID=UPI003BF3AB10
MNLKLKSFITGAALGAIVYQIAVHLIGFTAALAIPTSIVSWAKENSANGPVLFVWDLFVVQLLGIGLLAAISTYSFLKLASLKRFYVAIGFVATETIFSYSYLFSTSSNQAFANIDNVLLAPHFLVVFLCVFLASNLVRRN